jgi:hypothetical protein
MTVVIQYPASRARYSRVYSRDKSAFLFSYLCLLLTRRNIPAGRSGVFPSRSTLIPLPLHHTSLLTDLRGTHFPVVCGTRRHPSTHDLSVPRASPVRPQTRSPAPFPLSGFPSLEPPTTRRRTGCSSVMWGDWCSAGTQSSRTC